MMDIQIYLSIICKVGLITKLINDFKVSGEYVVSWNAINVPSGVYFIRMNVNGFSSSQKVMLIK